MAMRSAATSLQEMSQLEQLLGYKFNDKSILLNSLVHKSFANENNDFRGVNNEKLELLGDSVLGMITIEYLYGRFINLSEGEIVKIKSAIVSEAMLADFAKSIHLGRYIYLSRGEIVNGGTKRSSTLADSFEALIGAIYLDGGIISARNVLLSFLIPRIEDINANERVKDYKTILQEYAQSKYKEVPKYSLDGEYGPDHNKIFDISIHIRGLKVGSAEGKSKKEAEQKAAKAATEYLKIQIEDLF